MTATIHDISDYQSTRLDRLDTAALQIALDALQAVRVTGELRDNNLARLNTAVACVLNVLEGSGK